MSERKLATIRRIAVIEPIEGADKIVKATVDGWKLVTAIDNGFNVGDLVVYLEIDSWVPHELAPFLSKGKEPSKFNGVKGEKLRTIKLRKQISQGLIMPISILPVSNEVAYCEGDDVTEILGIQKWEAPLNVQLAGVCRGTFPSFGRKTDQERIQNLNNEFEEYKKLTWEVTEKCEGSSMSVYFNNSDFGVCSRNLNLKDTEGNAFWKVAHELKLQESLEKIGRNLMIQGELIGPDIQRNIYKLAKYEMYLFDIFDIDKQEYFTSLQRLEFAKTLGLKHSPVLAEDYKFGESDTIQEVLDMAEDKSKIADVQREGIVFKCVEDPSISFKAISNVYLLGEKE